MEEELHILTARCPDNDVEIGIDRDGRRESEIAEVLILVDYRIIPTPQTFFAHHLHLANFHLPLLLAPLVHVEPDAGKEQLRSTSYEQRVLQRLPHHPHHHFRARSRQAPAGALLNVPLPAQPCMLDHGLDVFLSKRERRQVSLEEED